MWVTMGPIANRSDERLGASDLAIVEFRKRMLEALKEFESGAMPIGTAEQSIPPTVCSYQAVIPKETDWRAYEVKYVSGDLEQPVLETNYQIKQ